METRLRMSGARIFPDVHVSGHAYREDHYEFLSLLNPRERHPSTRDLAFTSAYAEFASELGYSLPTETLGKESRGYDVHLLANGYRVKLQ